MSYGIKRTMADVYFSKAVREAQDYICESCGHYGRHEPQAMDLSHYFGRRHKRTRFEPLNASCLCRGCHNRLGESPHDHRAFIEDKLGPQKYGILVELHNQIVKIPKAVEKEIAKYYRQEEARIKAERDNGATGVISIVGYF